MILSFLDKVTTGTVAPVVCIATSCTGGLRTALNVLDISETTHLFDHEKSSSISQLINGKSRDLQKLLKCFNGTTASACNI